MICNWLILRMSRIYHSVHCTLNLGGLKEQLTEFLAPSWKFFILVSFKRFEIFSLTQGIAFM